MRPDAKEIKARIDLVEYIVSAGIALKAVGTGGEYRASCPFHGDDVPSLQVNRRKGLWRCFGCGAGGDVISFVMKRDDVGFRDALATLADLACLAGLAGPVRSEGTDLGCIFRAVADYWSKCLDEQIASAPSCRQTGGSTSALSYLSRRGIGSPEIIKRYRIGFAPGGTKTKDRLFAKGFTLKEIKAAGLVNGRGLDSFFGRVTFPLTECGRVVNVYGRSLSDRFKHMYLPARRDVVFGLEQVRGKRAILTESVIDALTLVTLGFDGAVSVLSARLTPRQVACIAGRFEHVVVAFDGDEAGAKGAVAAASALRERGVDARVVSLPDGSDINSLVVDSPSSVVLTRILREDEP